MADKIRLLEKPTCTPEEVVKICDWDGCTEATQTKRHRFCAEHTKAHNKQKDKDRITKWKSGFIYDMF